jgi:hypothetical protein
LTLICRLMLSEIPWPNQLLVSVIDVLAAFGNGK